MPSVLDRPPPRADHRLTYGPHPAHHADLWIPSGANRAPLVVALHGGYWRAENDLAHLGHLCRALRDAGSAVLSLEYRRLGMDDVGLRAILDDVRAGVAHGAQLAAAFAVRPGAPVLLGHSAGGHLALWVAKEAPVRGVVALAPISDLRLGASLRLDRGIVDTLVASAGGADAYPLASPAERLPLGVRQIVLHGADDRGVPVAMSEAYASRARALGDDVALHVLPAVGHLELIDPEAAAFSHVRAAIDALLSS
jgi:acetyl esterase/lipase